MEFGGDVNESRFNGVKSSRHPFGCTFSCTIHREGEADLAPNMVSDPLEEDGNVSIYIQLCYA